MEAVRKETSVVPRRVGEIRQKMETVAQDALARLDNRTKTERREWMQKLVRNGAKEMKRVGKKSKRKSLAKVVRQTVAARRWNKLCATLLDVAEDAAKRTISTVQEQIRKSCSDFESNKRMQENSALDSMDELDHEEALCTRLVVDTLAKHEQNGMAGRLVQPAQSCTYASHRQWNNELDMVYLPMQALEEAIHEMEQELRRHMSTENCLLQWCNVKDVASTSFLEELESYLAENFTQACECDRRGLKMLTWEDWKKQAAHRRGKGGMGYRNFLHFIQWIYEDTSARTRYLLPAFLERLVCLDRMSMAELERVDGEPLVYANEKCLQLVAAAYLALFCSEYTGI